MYIQAWGEKKVQKERGDASPYDLAILLESFWLESILAEWYKSPQKGPWVRMIGQRQSGN